MSDSALLHPTERLFRILGKPARSQRLERLEAARRRYFEIHDRLNFPSHFSEIGKAVNVAVWSQVLRVRIERARDVSESEWRRLRDWASRVERGQDRRPVAFEQFAEAERAAACFPELANRLYR